MRINQQAMTNVSGRRTKPTRARAVSESIQKVEEAVDPFLLGPYAISFETKIYSRHLEEPNLPHASAE